MRRSLIHLLLLAQCRSEHSSTRSGMLPALEDCKLERERGQFPEARNNRITNVLMHDHDLNVSLKMYIMPPLRVRLEAPTMRNDMVLAIHAQIFIKMTYFDPAVPNSSYASLTPPCDQLWLPQPRTSDTVGWDAPTGRAATLRIKNERSSLWDERTFAFPQSNWAFVNFPYDAHVATLRFKVNDANIRDCNDAAFRAHTRKGACKQARRCCGWRIWSCAGERLRRHAYDR